MSNTVTPVDVARMVERYYEKVDVQVREVAVLNAEADDYPTEKETYWGRRKRLEGYWFSEGCGFVFDKWVAPLWKTLHKRYWDAVVAERNV